MRHSHEANFCVHQVHQDHVQIIDENKQAEWDAWVHSEAYLSACQYLHVAANDAQMKFDQCRQLHLQNSSCKQSKITMQSAARRLSNAQKDLATLQTPNYFYDVCYDSIFSFEFALDNEIFIMY